MPHQEVETDEERLARQIEANRQRQLARRAIFGQTRASRIQQDSTRSISGDDLQLVPGAARNITAIEDEFRRLNNMPSLSIMALV